MLLLNYGMSLKCSESSERARQTGSTALKGTSRNAPKAIKRLSTRQRRRRIPRCPFLPRTSGRPRGVWVGQAAVGAAAAPDPTGRALPAPERQRLPVPNILAVPALQRHHRPSVPLPSRPTIRRSIVWSRRTASGTAIPRLPATIQRRSFFPSRLSGLRRRGRCRAGCRAVAERSGRGGKGPRMRCWSKWPVGQSDPIGYWLVAAAVLEPEPLPTVVITTTKGRWRIKGGE